jgi:chromosome segregation ATPase
MQKAVHCKKKLEKSKKEMADMDQVACKVNERRDELEERLAKCEEKFMQCCNENHELKDQLLQQPRSHSCNCRDKAATEKKKLQAKLDQMARELIEKNDNGLDSYFETFVPQLMLLHFREKVDE